MYVYTIIEDDSCSKGIVSNIMMKVAMHYTSLRKNVVFPSICVEGNVKEIVQYRVKFPSVSEKSIVHEILPYTAHFLVLEI